MYAVAGALFGAIVGYLIGTALYAITLSASIYNTTLLAPMTHSATGFPLIFALGFAGAGFGFGIIYSYQTNSQ
ncbi:MAG: hypothetical protein QXF80_07265 [Thermoplasmatales archaeon]